MGLYRSRQPAGIVTIAREKNALSAQNIGRCSFPLSSTRFVTADASTFEFDGGGQLRQDRRIHPRRRIRSRRARAAGRGCAEGIDGPIRLRRGRNDADRRQSRAICSSSAVVRTRENRADARIPDGFSSSLGWIVFHRDGAGRATGLSVSQDRVVMCVSPGRPIRRARARADEVSAINSSLSAFRAEDHRRDRRNPTRPLHGLKQL